MVNRMCRREVLHTVGCSVHRKPYIIHKKFHKFGNGLHTKSHLNPKPNHLTKATYTNIHIQSTLPLLSSSAYPSAGTPIPFSPSQTSPGALLFPLTSPSRCAPGDSAGPWRSSVCPPGASAALLSPGGALMSHRAVLLHSVTAQSLDLLLLTGPLH